MNCIIVDDDRMCQENIKWLCGKMTDLNVIGIYSNPIEALVEVPKLDVDILFLDIHMPEMTGMEFLASMDGSSSPAVILTTSDSSFALEAFEFKVLDYLVKPVTFPRFLKAINKYKDDLASRSKGGEEAKSELNELYVNIDKRLVRIDFDIIQLVEAKGDYILIKTEKGNHLVHTTLKKIEQKLPESQFLRVHRSYIVNLSKIVDIQDSTIVINRDVIPISRANREKLRTKLNML